MKHQTSYRQRVFVTVGRPAVAQGPSGLFGQLSVSAPRPGWVRTGVTRRVLGVDDSESALRAQWSLQPRP